MRFVIFFFCLFIALGFMGVLYRLPHLRVSQINKRKEQPILTVLVFFLSRWIFFLILAHSLRSICLITPEYNLFNVQHQCIPGPIILIAHGCLHRHRRSHMRLCFFQIVGLTDCVPQFNQVQHMNHMRLGRIV